MTKTTQTSSYFMPGFKNFWVKFQKNLIRIGGSLLFPIATLPVAAILLRIGAQLPTGTAFADFVQKIISAGGQVVFDNLQIIFAIGVAFGLTKDKRGEAALAGFIAITLITILMKQGGVDLTGTFYSSTQVDFHEVFGDNYDSILANNVLNGIIVGSLVAYIYNKYNAAELPDSLGFFSGRRLIPVLTILLVLVFGVVYAIVFPWIGYGIYYFSDSLAQATSNRWSNAGIMFVYGIINRLLIPFGLHHIPNTLFWFTLGEGVTETGEIVTGDINIFLSGVAEGNTAGTFQSGFFVIFMFGLPALALAFYVTAENNQQKKRVFAMFASAAFVSFLTGITEPIEFAFLFVAPSLFLTHAFLTGFFGFIVGLFGIQVGFGFSAGFLDYLISIPKSLEIIEANKTGFDAFIANPGWIIVIGVVCGLTYFYVGRYLIKKLNLSTPGRGNNLLGEATKNDAKEKPELETNGKTTGSKLKECQDIIKAVGGTTNIINLSNCATRLRFELRDNSKINQSIIRQTKALGQVKIKGGYQIIMGPKVEMYANILSDLLKTNKA